MRLGLIARADQRGIGYQTREFMRHMPVDKVLVIRVAGSTWEEDVTQFPQDGTLVATWHPQDNESLSVPVSTLTEWLRDLDVVFAVETVYCWDLIRLAREVDTRVVIQGNPEFYLHGTPPWHGRPHPDQWWWPTTWETHRLPNGPVVPVPIPDDAPRLARDPDDGPLVVTFVGGHAAHRDRAGVMIVEEAARQFDGGIVLRAYSQDQHLIVDLHTSRKHDVAVSVHAGGVDDRWEMYAGAHVLLAPRRYGGLSLPTQEAMACGLGVLMPEGSPNSDWPTVPLRTAPSHPIMVQSGYVPHLHADPYSTAVAINRLHHDRRHLRDVQQQACSWAEENTWAKWAPVYMRLLERAADGETYL